MKIVHRFLNKGGQFWRVLQVFGKLYIFNKCSTYRTIYLLREFITIVEAFAECLHLIAIASKAETTKKKGELLLGDCVS